MNVPSCAATACAFLFAFVSPSIADKVPGQPPSNIFHFSTNLESIHVVLVNDSIGKENLPDLIVPRAYVIFTTGNRTSDKGPLPAKFSSDQVRLMFVEGSGQAWNIAVSERAKREGISLSEAASLMRDVRMDMAISSTNNPRGRADAAERQKKRLKPQAENVEGLTLYRDGISSFEYYLGEARDDFFSVTCAGRPNPLYLCTFAFNVTSGVVADVTFADFRVHGGRAWANRRIQFSRQLACKFLTRC